MKKIFIKENLVKKINISVIFILLCILNICGCKKVTTEENDGQDPKPSCVHTTNIMPKAEYDYLYGYVEDALIDCQIFTKDNDNGARFQKAFKRCGCQSITFFPQQEGSNNSLYNLDSIADKYALDNWMVNTYKPNHYNHTDIQNNPLDSAYLLSINTISSNNKTLLGLSNAQEHYSIVIAGNLRFCFPTFIAKALQKCATHEMGHFIGVINDEGTLCSGNYSTICVMKQGGYEIGNEIMEKCRFCDYHACMIYNRLISKFKSQPIFSLSNIYSGSLQSNRFSFNINSNKEEYLQLEPIWLTLTIKNIGEKLDSIDIHEATDFLPKITVTNSQGINLEYRYFIGSYNGPNYVKIRPGEEICYLDEISICFGQNRIENYPYNPRHYFSEGQYKVSCKYYTDTVKLISNEISFKILKPKGDELKLFSEILSLCSSNLEINKRKDALLVLYDTYPNSVYEEEVFSIMNK